MKNGICYLVGAGPGDPGLITRRGLECLRQAEVVFHDHLAAPELLDELPPSAERIYVGKEAGMHSVPQDQICQRLCDAVLAGKVVVRLKGGDPFVFGRGGEEALALSQAGCRFEVVPGISSGVAAPAYAGIPVTHRGVSTAVTFVTGHEDPLKPTREVDWRALGSFKHTLCIFMGVENLGVIASELMAGGRPGKTPVAIIQNGATLSQRVTTGRLESIAEQAAGAGIKPPAMVVVGEVADLREGCGWFEQRPLFGLTAIVTRSRIQAGVMSRLLEAAGARTLEMPAIEIEPAPATIPPHFLDSLTNIAANSSLPLAEADKLSAALARQHHEGAASWAIFTSVNGVELVWQRLELLGLDSRIWGCCRIAAIGEATAEALRQHGIKADLVPEKYVAEELFAALQAHLGHDLAGQRCLLLRASNARPDLRELLAGAGAVVEDVPVYQTLPVETASPEALKIIEGGEADIIPFASSSTVEGFCRIMKDNLARLLASDRRPIFASIGPITSATMREKGIPVDVEAHTHTIPALVEAICAKAAERKRNR